MQGYRSSLRMLFLISSGWLHVLELILTPFWLPCSLSYGILVVILFFALFPSLYTLFFFSLKIFSSCVDLVLLESTLHFSFSFPTKFNILRKSQWRMWSVYAIMDSRLYGLFLCYLGFHIPCSSIFPWKYSGNDWIPVDSI